MSRYVVVAMLLAFAAPLAAAYTADEVLRQKTRLQGHVISVEGFVRFDRLSQRGFLYRNLTDMRHLNYRKTVFLELGNEGYSSLRIPDGSYVVAAGYLSAELRGPLGVYPAHIIVDRLKVLRKTRSESAHSVERKRPNQAMQRTAGRSAFDLPMISTFDLQPRAPSPAVADLVSR